MKERFVTKGPKDLSCPSWTLTRHLTLLKIKEGPTCHLCGEEYDTCLRLPGRCSAFVRKQRKQFWKTFC